MTAMFFPPYIKAPPWLHIFNELNFRCGGWCVPRNRLLLWGQKRYYTNIYLYSWHQGWHGLAIYICIYILNEIFQQAECHGTYIHPSQLHNSRLSLETWGVGRYSSMFDSCDSCWVRPKVKCVSSCVCIVAWLGFAVRTRGWMCVVRYVSFVDPLYPLTFRSRAAAAITWWKKCFDKNGKWALIWERIVRYRDDHTTEKII